MDQYLAQYYFQCIYVWFSEPVRKCPVLLFADDVKIYKEIVSAESYQALQRDLEKLDIWSNRGLLKFNPEKCTTMHLGHRNPKYVYQLDNEDLKETSLEKDLGVHISSDLKPEKHISSIASKGNKMVGLFKRNFGDLDIESCKTLLFVSETASGVCSAELVSVLQERYQ